MRFRMGYLEITTCDVKLRLYPKASFCIYWTGFSYVFWYLSTILWRHQQYHPQFEGVCRKSNCLFMSAKKSALIGTTQR